MIKKLLICVLTATLLGAGCGITAAAEVYITESPLGTDWEFDNTEHTLTANVSGFFSPVYCWMKGSSTYIGDAPTIPVKNVTDSGDYVCYVTEYDDSQMEYSALPITIRPKQIDVEILKQTYICDGTGHFPDFRVKDAIKDQDYTISGCSEPQTKPGHYTTTIQGINNRCGTQTIEWDITPNPAEPDEPTWSDQSNPA